jgi:hypothetical protein
MIPRVPFYSELEQVAHRLINNGNIWGPTTSYVASALTPRFGLSTCEDDLGRLRAKVLEALPVLLGWLKAHEVMTLIPVSPLNAMPPVKPPTFVWECGTGNLTDRMIKELRRRTFVNGPVNNVTSWNTDETGVV